MSARVSRGKMLKLRTTQRLSLVPQLDTLRISNSTRPEQKSLRLSVHTEGIWRFKSCHGVCVCVCVHVTRTHTHTHCRSNFPGVMPSKAGRATKSQPLVIEAGGCLLLISSRLLLTTSSGCDWFFFSLPRIHLGLVPRVVSVQRVTIMSQRTAAADPPGACLMTPRRATRRCSSPLTSRAIINTLSPGPFRLCQVSASPTEVHCGIAPGTCRRRPRRRVRLVLKKQDVCL